MCGQSRDFRVCRRVTRRVADRDRLGVFCSLFITTIDYRVKICYRVCEMY